MTPEEIAAMNQADLEAAHATAAARIKEIGDKPANLGELNERNDLVAQIPLLHDAVVALASADIDIEIEDLSAAVAAATAKPEDDKVDDDDKVEDKVEDKVDDDKVEDKKDEVPAPDLVTAGAGAVKPPTKVEERPKTDFVMASLTNRFGMDSDSTPAWKKVRNLFTEPQGATSGMFGEFKGIYGEADPATSLTSDPQHNAELLAGVAAGEGIPSVMSRSVPENGRMSVTAAINCKGVPEAIMNIPFCYKEGRPLVDSGVVALLTATEGQIQVYGPWVPATQNGFNEDVQDCADCNAIPAIQCATHACIAPLPPMEPKRVVSCLCVPESLQWAHRYVFERAMEDFAIQGDRRAELRYINQIRELSMIRNVTALLPTDGAATIIKKSLMTVQQRIMLEPRNTQGSPFEGWVAFVPSGQQFFKGVEMDTVSRRDAAAHPGEDILEEIQKMGAQVVFGLDPNYDNSPTAALASWGSTALGEANKIALETPVSTGEIMMIPRNTLASGTLGQTQLGMADLEKDEIKSGCRKLIRSEWEFDLFTYGSCARPLTLSYTNLPLDGRSRGILTA